MNQLSLFLIHSFSIAAFHILSVTLLNCFLNVLHHGARAEVHRVQPFDLPVHILGIVVVKNDLRL